MQTVTYEEFLEFGPYWPVGPEWAVAAFDRFGGRMSALDFLNLNDVSTEDKLWTVLHEAFIPAPVLHEFACVCAEYALSLIETPDPRSIRAIEVKRAWVRGEATVYELDAASDAAWDAFDAAKAAAYADARDASWDAAWVARAPKDAIWVAAKDAARNAAWDVIDIAELAGVAAAKAAVLDAMVAYLIMTLED